MCYVNVHLDVITSGVDTSAHWLLDVIAADHGHEFFAGVCYFISRLRRSLNESVCIFVSVYCIRSISVMPWAQVDGEAVGFADLAQAMPEKYMVLLYVLIFAIALIYS